MYNIYNDRYDGGGMFSSYTSMMKSGFDKTIGKAFKDKNSHVYNITLFIYSILVTIIIIFIFLWVTGFIGTFIERLIRKGESFSDEYDDMIIDYFGEKLADIFPFVTSLALYEAGDHFLKNLKVPWRKESFTTGNSNSNLAFIYSEQCVYCKRMKEAFTNSGTSNSFHWISASTPEGQKYINLYRLSGFPAFVHKKNGNVIQGYTEDIRGLINNLNK